MAEWITHLYLNVAPSVVLSCYTMFQSYICFSSNRLTTTTTNINNHRLKILDYVGCILLILLNKCVCACVCVFSFFLFHVRNIEQPYKSLYDNFLPCIHPILSKYLLIHWIGFFTLFWFFLFYFSATFICVRIMILYIRKLS